MFASIICAFVGSSRKKNVCKSCARKPDVQTLCKPNLPRNLCKPCAKFWPALARGWPVARPGHCREGKVASGDSKRREARQGFFFPFAGFNCFNFFTAASKSFSAGLGSASSSTRNFENSSSAFFIACSWEIVPA